MVCGAILALMMVCATPFPTFTPPAPTPAPIGLSPAPPGLPAPPAGADAVTIYYEGFAQVELIGPTGARVLIDVHVPGALSTRATRKDILLTTHTDSDHFSMGFVQAFPGEQLMIKAGQIQRSDVAVHGIASVHDANETPRPEGGGNYIYLIEIGGLRIAHFGDIGQDALTSEQLSALGRVDVAITQLANRWSTMSAENRKGIKLMEQVHPALIIPTHADAEILKIAVATWPLYCTMDASVRVSAQNLPAETRLLVMGEWGALFCK